MQFVCRTQTLDARSAQLNRMVNKKEHKCWVINTLYYINTIKYTGGVWRVEGDFFLVKNRVFDKKKWLQDFCRDFFFFFFLEIQWRSLMTSRRRLWSSLPTRKTVQSLARVLSICKWYYMIWLHVVTHKCSRCVPLGICNSSACLRRWSFFV